MGIYAKKVLLFGDKMEIPMEVICTFVLSHPPMLAVTSFESGKVALKAIG
jgi:hypothetical protein